MSLTDKKDQKGYYINLLNWVDHKAIASRTSPLNFWRLQRCHGSAWYWFCQFIF
ncbi:hypothetical protein [Nostoc sp. LPT]|uniref:hypothetical protein n=1 Tax=Nostoc sp. LPT TaxID=2815387 RepID=UPI0025E11323|nr:hypothetical protein [Nostoc sp. LPT]